MTTKKTGKTRAARLGKVIAALSVLSVSVGMVAAQAADNSVQIKGETRQHKTSTQIKLNSSQNKTSTQIKGESSQIKLESTQHKGTTELISA